MAFYLFILTLNPWVNFAIVALLAVLVFVPIKYIYPSRTTFFYTLNLVATSLWGVAIIAIFLTYPNHSPWFVWIALLYALYYTAMSLTATYLTRNQAGK